MSFFVIGSTLAHLLLSRECATPPHIQVCYFMWLSFIRPSPALVLQATNAGVRRPGYETSCEYQCSSWNKIHYCNSCTCVHTCSHRILR